MANNKELKKLRIIKKVIEKEIKQTQAAEVLGLSKRQIIRLVAKVRQEGDSVVVRRLSGEIFKQCCS